MKKKITFYLRFNTQMGQSLHISGNSTALGSDDPAKTFAMEYMNDEFWHATLEMEMPEPLRYHYLLRQQDGTMTVEWGNDRVLPLTSPGTNEVQVIDTWNHAGEYENVFFTSPFEEILLPHHASPEKTPKGKFSHVFKVKAPLLKKEEALCLIGSGLVLKDWDTSSPLLMQREGSWWVARLNIPKEGFPLQYKYGTYHTREKRFLQYEGGNNRLLHGDAAIHKLTITHDGFAQLPNNTWRGAGVAIPVFSLRSKRSLGVGEFTDLKLLVDWARATGLKLVQILPVNDTTANHNWQDSYPYAAISAFALHPLYLNLEKCAGSRHAELIKLLRKRQKELNDLPEVDYEEVMRLKLGTAKELFLLQKEEFLQHPEWLRFFEMNRHWLEPYAAFCYLRDKHGTPDFTRWPAHSRYDKTAIHRFVSGETEHYDAIALQYFIQYHLHLQLREAADYAHEHGIIMKGDIPIGIYRYSCDAWINPRLYHMDLQAGAPPDNFAIHGQNWGFPTYNWEEMEKDGFAWWKERFKQMSNYFDAFRIDHILGFFRIWSIPLDAVQGILGHFVPAIPVSRQEFADRNICFDPDRYTHPFINDAVLEETFGSEAAQIRNNFLEPGPNGTYTLKEPYNTQQQVAAYFATDANSLCAGLFDLISNVILLEDPGAAGYHFRIDMDTTSSFRHLDEYTRQQLRDLYLDYFYRRQDDFWRQEALHKLPALKRATNMLICGEDLGMVPHCVPDVMKHLGILSLEIQRMPKMADREFSRPAEAPYLSVVTPSTHDMSTIRGWWEEDKKQTQRFFNSELEQWGEAPPHCEPWVNKAIVLQHLHSPALWSIFQLQDLLGMSEQLRRPDPGEERINVPANSHHYWKYRVHLCLEDLIGEREFNKELKAYITGSGR